MASTPSVATPKYKINDQVNRKKNTGVLLKTIKTVGVIIGIEEKFNSRGRVCFYYNVKWPNGRTSEHAQHILCKIND